MPAFAWLGEILVSVGSFLFSRVLPPIVAGFGFWFGNKVLGALASFGALFAGWEVMTKTDLGLTLLEWLVNIATFLLPSISAPVFYNPSSDSVVIQIFGWVGYFLPMDYLFTLFESYCTFLTIFFAYKLIRQYVFSISSSSK